MQTSGSDSRRAHYRMTLLHDLLMETSGQDEAGVILNCLVERLRSFMDVHYVWLLTVEGDHFKTYTHPAGQAMMGKETIALLMSGEVHAIIPNLAEYRNTLGPTRAGGMAYFPGDAKSLIALPAQRGRRTDGYLVIASRVPDAYNQEQEDFLFELMLILRPIFRMLRLQASACPEGTPGIAKPPATDAHIPDDMHTPSGAQNLDLPSGHHPPDFAPLRLAPLPSGADMLIHDLRAPLGIINWNMEQLLDGVTGALSPEQERFVRASIESTKELLEMADSLLDIDRLEGGLLALSLEDCSLDRLAQDIAGRMDFVTRQMAITFSFNFPDDYPAIRADRQLMRRVLFNLLFNASKYVPEKSVIHIAGGFNADTIWLSIEDEGQGIPEQYLESIFDKYVQAEARDASESIRGKGLGLTFCRLAVQAHGGGIRAENARGGCDTDVHGARFIVEIPRAREEK